MSWGYKITYHVYVEGQRESGEKVLAGANTLAVVFPGSFVGAAIEDVDEEPRDQIAT